MAKGTTFGYQNYTSSIDNRSGLERFEAIGHPGKYIAVQDIAHNTTTFFTGSNIGVGGFILQSADGAHADTKLTFTGGGMTTGVGLTAGVFYEFSLKKLTMRNNSNAKAKVFWTNSNPGTKLSDTNNAG